MGNKDLISLEKLADLERLVLRAKTNVSEVPVQELADGLEQACLQLRALVAVSLPA